MIERKWRQLRWGALLIVAVACRPSLPLEFRDWSIPVAEDTPVRSLANVEPRERTEDLDLERDLVVGAAFGKPFYTPKGVAVDEKGNIYVLDAGNNRVVVFDPDGTPIRTFGRLGQGPGEFHSARLIAVVGERVIVHSQRGARWSIFDLAGNSLADHAVDGRFLPETVVGWDKHVLLLNRTPSFVLPGGAHPPSMPWIAGQYALDARPVAKYVELEQRTRSYWANEAEAGSIPLRAGYPAGVIGADGRIYITSGVEYQVLAMSPNGTPRWALRVAYVAPAPSDEYKREVVALLRLDSSDVTWPEHFATIENLEVDARGNLYVFPHAGRRPENWRQTHERVPVDVYSPEGGRQFAGWSAIEDWDAARGEYVYRIEVDSRTQEHVMARYRVAGSP